VGPIRFTSAGKEFLRDFLPRSCGQTAVKKFRDGKTKERPMV